MKFKNKLKMRLGIAIVYVIIGVLLVVLTSIGIIKNEVMLAFGNSIRCLRFGDDSKEYQNF